MQFELGSKEDEQRSRPTFGLWYYNVNDVLKSRLSCDGLSLVSASALTIFFGGYADAL
jgi:hypothetical protein